MSGTLHVFAVNAETQVRHTHLTRANGEAPALPPLTAWLGAEVDTDEIELFPVGDLGEMSLSEYVTMAFAPEGIPPRTAQRMDALTGHVLLVPDPALGAAPAPGPEATPVASLALAAADHGSSLPKADMTPPPRRGPDRAAWTPPPGAVVWVIGAVIALALLLAVAVQ